MKFILTEAFIFAYFSARIIGFQAGMLEKSGISRFLKWWIDTLSGPEPLY